MRISQMMILIIAMCMFCTAANAAAFPDLACFLGTECRLFREGYQFSEDFLCDAYVWAYPVGWDTGNDAALALLAQWSHGWEWEAGEVEGYEAYLLTAYNGDEGMLISDFNNHVLALLPVGCAIEPLQLVKDEQQEQAAQIMPAPSAPQTEAGQSNIRWEWIEVEADCPACVGGTCRECNGTGTYRLYGETIPCTRYCTICDGEGTYTRQEYIQIGD